MRIRLTRLFEISRYLNNKSGQELKGVLEYLSELSHDTIRSLKNGLNFRDNFDCETKTVSLMSNTETVIAVPEGKRPTQILLKRVLDDVFYVVDSFGWKYQSDGSVVIKAVFTGSPTVAISAEIVLLY